MALSNAESEAVTVDGLYDAVLLRAQLLKFIGTVRRLFVCFVCACARARASVRLIMCVRAHVRARMPGEDTRAHATLTHLLTSLSGAGRARVRCGRVRAGRRRRVRAGGRNCDSEGQAEGYGLVSRAPRCAIIVIFVIASLEPFVAPLL